jgi:hypothetical protein
MGSSTCEYVPLRSPSSCVVARYVAGPMRGGRATPWATALELLEVFELSTEGRMSAFVAPKEVLARLRCGGAKPQVKLLIGVSDPYRVRS